MDWTQHKLKLAVTALIVAASMLAWPMTGWAGDDADVVLLLTEVVDEPDADDHRIAFWWSQADRPDWTETDQVVFEALRAAGVNPVMPEEIDISRIYRRPGLSNDNAAHLGRLLDGDRVLVGEVQYQPLAPVAPLGYHGLEARAVVDLVPAGAAESVSLERFTVTRNVFAPRPDDLLDRARQAIGGALGEVMGQSLRRAGGEVGSQNHDDLLAVRNVERAENLEAIRERIVAIDEVERVVERWASEGIIALEVLAHNDESGIAEYAFRVLENHEFDDFDLMRHEHPAADGVTEFWLQPRTTDF